ncbi:hypothetical protein [Rahnella woolbedingensis]|uniref:hypothetical protein n=1 Tax=Rahnella woolbedingensis TaxID=1510574 RepID=UPI001FCA4523|nr:hypothetical protein [Rahnella woolbedingensis]
MKKIVLGLAVIIIALIIFKSCSSSASVCGSKEHDLLRSVCEKSLGVDPKG